MPWWIWLLAGLGLLGAELLTPGGFYLIFFGLAGLIVGLLGLLGVPLHPAVQWLLFAALSLAAIAFFRRPLLRWMEAKGPGDRADELTGEIALPVAAIAAGAVGQAELRGTVWSARNAATRQLAAGERCRVLRVEGLQIHIGPE